MSAFLRIVCLIGGLAMAAYMYTQVGILRFLAGVAETDPAGVATLQRGAIVGYVIVALLLAGAVLSFPKPLAGSIAFVLAGAAGLISGGAPQSTNLVWFGAALLLAALDYLAFRIERDEEPSAPGIAASQREAATASATDGGR